MPIPNTSSVTFTGLEDAGDHVASVVLLVQSATAAIALTEPANITSECDPDTEVTAGFRNTLFAQVQADDLRAPIVSALDGLKAALNVVLAAYDCPPV